MSKPLDFELPIVELHDKIKALKKLSGDGSAYLDDEIKQIEARAIVLKKEIFANLKPDQIIQIARHQNRPDSTSLIQLISSQYYPLNGDRLFRDDPSIVGGLCLINGQRTMFIGHQKGHDTKGNVYRNFGMPHPEGYRKALRLMKMAEKFDIPILTFIDTPGAYPGLEAEERGQAEAIATNLKEMSSLTVPIISVVIGEGGSGGALAIGICNYLIMMQYSVYSVISPEGCASILFRDASKSAMAAKSLKITASDIRQLGIADEVVPEPMGGAHNHWNQTADALKNSIQMQLDKLGLLSKDEIVSGRYDKFRVLGQNLQNYISKA
jgi:acetyl-CoA carboxylase carboxyl transferase subunit alpha